MTAKRYNGEAQIYAVRKLITRLENEIMPGESGAAPPNIEECLALLGKISVEIGKLSQIVGRYLRDSDA